MQGLKVIGTSERNTGADTTRTTVYTEALLDLSRRLVRCPHTSCGRTVEARYDFSGWHDFLADPAWLPCEDDLGWEPLEGAVAGWVVSGSTRTRSRRGGGGRPRW